MTGVNFARGNTGPSRSFDFDVTMKNGQRHTFMGMDKYVSVFVCLFVCLFV